MAGIRHHILPRFLLKGFNSRTDKNAQFTWLYRKNQKPVEVSTKDVNIEKYFYGRDGEPYADPEITKIEVEFAIYLDEIRNKSLDIEVCDDKIINFLAHLSVRTKNARDSLYQTIDYWSEQISNYFSNVERIKKPLFKLLDKSMLESIEKNYPQLSQQEKIELHKLLTSELKRNFERVKDTIPEEQFEILKEFQSDLPQKIKHKHNELILQNIVPDDMVKVYEKLNWYICKTKDKLILSDVGSVTETVTKRRFKSHEFDFDKIVNVFLPVASNNLVVGTRFSSLPNFDIKTINSALAKCAGDFFIFSENSPNKQSLSNKIGEWFGLLTQDEMEFYIRQFFEESLDKLGES